MDLLDYVIGLLILCVIVVYLMHKEATSDEARARENEVDEAAASLKKWEKDREEEQGASKQ